MEVQPIILHGLVFISLFFEVFLLITYFEVRKELEFEAEILSKEYSFFPTVTIIVPCFNEQDTVEKTIRSILSLDYPSNRLSILAIDDGSTDATLEKLFEIKQKYPQIKVLSKENGGKHTALNLALESVETDLVGCLDADSFVDSAALKKITPFFENETIMAVTPSIKVYEPKSVIQHIQNIEYSWGIFLRRMLSSLGALYVTPGPFSIFRTRVFRELGGYRHAHHTEDLEFALRMQKNRYKIVNSCGAHVFTVAPAGLRALYKQRVRWTYGFLNNVIDYRELLFNKKYGHIGFFILPIATTSIFSSLYIVGSAIWGYLIKFADTVIKIRVVGLAEFFSLPSFSFDWFFVSTNTLNFLVIATMGFYLIILILSLLLSEGRIKISRGVFYYLFLYTFLVPLWLSKAVFATVTGRKVNWR